MLGIPKQFLDCSVYLYKTQAQAEAGEQSGGSGFLVGVPLTENPEETQLYVVTNEHVIRKMDSPTIRQGQNGNRWLEGCATPSTRSHLTSYANSVH